MCRSGSSSLVIGYNALSRILSSASQAQDPRGGVHSSTQQDGHGASTRRGQTSVRVSSLSFLCPPETPRLTSAQNEQGCSHRHTAPRRHAVDTQIDGRKTHTNRAAQQTDMDASSAQVGRARPGASGGDATMKFGSRDGRRYYVHTPPYHSSSSSSSTVFDDHAAPELPEIFSGQRVYNTKEWARWQGVSSPVFEPQHRKFTAGKGVLRQFIIGAFFPFSPTRCACRSSSPLHFPLRSPRQRRGADPRVAQDVYYHASRRTRSCCWPTAWPA